MGELTTTDTTVNLADSTEKLHNFWVLKTVDDVALNAAEFTGGSPYLNLDLENNKVSGYAGCNGINGTVKVETNKIRFGKITTTKMSCNSIKFEKGYLDNLSGRTVTYELSPGQLKLKTNNGPV
jgi:heat shock protein HslJ